MLSININVTEESVADVATLLVVGEKRIPKKVYEVAASGVTSLEDVELIHRIIEALNKPNSKT